MINFTTGMQVQLKSGQHGAMTVAEVKGDIITCHLRNPVTGALDPVKFHRDELIPYHESEGYDEPHLSFEDA